MSKLRRRLTVQGDSDNIDGGGLAELQAGRAPMGLSRPKPPKNEQHAEDVRFNIDIKPCINLRYLYQLILP